MTARTPGPWNLEIGENRCFHGGNRVAITVTTDDDGEIGNPTIAEVWPSRDDTDIEDGRFIVEACNAHDRLTRERDEAVALLRRFVQLYSFDGSYLAASANAFLARYDGDV